MDTPATPFIKFDIEDFLRPLSIDNAKAHALSHELCRAFQHLSAHSLDQFLPTPISESILRPTAGREKGRGGTNLRVGFIELLGNEINVNGNGVNGHSETSESEPPPNLRRVLEKSWPILEVLKNENADSLFKWIGSCIAEVVREGCGAFNLPRDLELPMGVTFSFPMVQETLADATLMAMGKGFAITSRLHLGTHLVNGYEQSKTPDLPPIKVSAILNDAVATLVSFIYQSKEDSTHKAAMGLICGTGSNATIPLKRSTLHKDKQPGKVKVLNGDSTDDMKIAVNTEWSIKGTAPTLRKFDLISHWDTKLDLEGEAPGFQPLEYMTAGRYLGELGRLILLDYLEHHLNIPADSLPPRLLTRFGLTTTFLSHFRPPHSAKLLEKLETEFPQSTGKAPFQWTEDIAIALYKISKAIEVRAAAIVAASIVGLLACAGDIPIRESLQDHTNNHTAKVEQSPKVNLIVGYTGGCIVHFQDYLADCQEFLDSIIEAEFGSDAPVRVVLSPCHDGGITGAGVLCGASQEPAPIAIPGSDGGYDDGSGSDLDANESDLLVARSFTSGASGLAPEAFESAMLRGRRRSQSTMRRASTVRSVVSVSPRPIQNGHRHHRDSEDLDSPLSEDSLEDDLEAAQLERSKSAPTFLIDTDQRRFWIVFISIMLTHFVACFDGTIMASSHPVITSYFHSSNSASWLTTAFLLTSTAFQPVIARLSDTLGRKPPYLATTVIFALATLWCALAQSMTSFILARAACGLGAGGVLGMGSIIISDLVPIERRGAYQSYVNVVYGLASALGAALGGLMADTMGWRWEFGIQVFPIVICFVVAFFGIPGDLGLQNKHQTFMEGMKTFDFKGSILLTTSTTFLILGINLGGNILPWSHPFIIASLVIFGVCFPICLYVESKHQRPIMPLILLHSSPRANLIFANFIASFLLNAILFNTPLFFQAVLLTSATTSGLYLVVPVVTASTTGTLTGFLISATRRLKWPLVCGTLLYLLGTALLSAMHRGWPVWAYLLCLIPSSAGQGFQFPGTFMAVLAASEHREQAVVTSTLVLWRALGSVLGVAFSSLVLQNALLRYLLEYVIPPSDVSDGEAWKQALVERVRESVEAVAALPPGDTRDQVIASYESAVRLTFLCLVAFAAVGALLIAPVKLPRLGGRK
ncbi:MFS general substrate transporter [Hypoxylon trugodes]|uniref:MFS general substrate transporter n=1 Tax=Hypoxylon trugodes TaxID=326681 RepID=UPI0021988AC2|nr:MFS general substrate transporter [Hypoxylon trugodes]KAI1394192.1 MFS general substrate transporter [Hypoxylon trugodes]